MGIKEVLTDMTREISRNRRKANDNQRMTTNGPFLAGRASPKTIVAGAIEVTRPHVVVLPESGISDNLDTITNFADGKFIIVATSDPAHTITVRDESISGGNIRLSGGATTAVLSDPEETLLLIYKDELGLWVQTGATASGGGAPALHASTHQHGGADEVATATPGANAIVKAAGTGKIANGWLDATLESLAALGTTADRIAYTTGVDTWAETPLTGFVRTILDDANQAAVQATLALVPGTNVQAQDAELQAIAGLASAADQVPYFTGSGTASLATFTAYGRTLVALADAVALRANINVEDGADVTDAVNIAGSIHGSTLDTTPLDADEVPSLDSSASFGLMRTTWTNIKAFLKTYFDGIYVLLGGKAGGQHIYGGLNASENITIESTPHATKGETIFPDNIVRFGPGTTFVTVNFNGAAGSSRDFRWQSAGVDRIFLRLNSSPESGSNEGSDLTVLTRADDGTSLDTQALLLKRSNSWLGLGTVLPAARVHIVQATLNSAVLRIETETSGTNPFMQWFQNRIGTTTATPATLHTFAIAASTIRFLHVRVGARRTGGTSGTGATGDGAEFELRGRYKNVGGTVTLIGALTSVADVEAGGASAAWTATLVISGTDVIVQVTGAASMNVTWWMIKAESSQITT